MSALVATAPSLVKLAELAEELRLGYGDDVEYIQNGVHYFDLRVVHTPPPTTDAARLRAKPNALRLAASLRGYAEQVEQGGMRIVNLTQRGAEVEVLLARVIQVSV